MLMSHQYILLYIMIRWHKPYPYLSFILLEIITYSAYDKDMDMLRCICANKYTRVVVMIVFKYLKGIYHNYIPYICSDVII